MPIDKETNNEDKSELEIYREAILNQPKFCLICKRNIDKEEPTEMVTVQKRPDEIEVEACMECAYNED